MKFIFPSEPHFVLENFNSFYFFVSDFTEKLLRLHLEPSLFLGRWIGILTLYLMHRGKLYCAGGALLSSYLIVLLVLLAVVICTVSAIVCVSMKGKG